MIERNSTHKVAGSGSEREKLHKMVGREWATSVSKGMTQRRRTPYHFLDFFGVGVSIAFFIAGVLFFCCFSLAT
jgi:hypothetical protein